MKQFRNSTLMSVLIGIIALCITPSAWADESALEFRVAPSSGSDVSDGGDYFVLSMQPGDVERQAVELTNPSTETLTVRLAAVDAATAQMGGVDYGAEQLTPTATGSWIVLDQERVDLEPGDSEEVAFEVNAPSDAASGVHLAGVVVWVDGAQQQQDAGAGATMNVQSRRVVAVQVDVPGPAAPVLEIRGAEAEARPDGLYLGIELFNSGNGFAKGTGTVSIEGRDGQGTFLVDTIVPRTGTIYPFRWAGSSVPSGSYQVAIEVDYGVRITSWQGEVIVGSAVQSDLRGRGVAGATGSGLRSNLLIAAVVLLIVVAALLFRRVLSRLPRLSLRRAPAPTPSSPVSPPRASVTRRLALTTARHVPRSEEVQRRVPPPPPPPPVRLAPPPPPPPGAGGRRDQLRVPLSSLLGE